MIVCEWHYGFSVGNRLIDAHHQKLFNLVNDLANAMLGGGGRNLLRQTFRELLRYTREHFAAEEKLFRATAYPQAEAHCQEHAKLVAELESLLARYEADESGISVQTLDFIKKWIETHIMETDMAYRDWLKD